MRDGCNGELDVVVVFTAVAVVHEWGQRRFPSPLIFPFPFPPPGQLHNSFSSSLGFRTYFTSSYIYSPSSLSSRISFAS